MCNKRIFSILLALMLVMSTLSGCGGTTNNGNGSSTGNTTESGMFNGSMGNDNAFGTTDGMVDSTTNGTDEGIVGGVVDDIVGGVDDMLNTTETGTGNTTNNTRNMGR